MADDNETRQVQVPVDEEELLPDGILDNKIVKDRTEPLTQKESMAFRLVCFCLVTVAIIIIVDCIYALHTKQERIISKEIIDIVKYVLTTALGYFFGTNRNK